MEHVETLAGTKGAPGHGQCGGEGKLLSVRITRQECNVCGGVRLQVVSTPQQQPEHTERWEHFSLFGISGQISCLNERHKVGIQTGVISEIPASCKVHSLVTALLIRLTHLCVKTFRTDGRQRKHANFTSVTCYGAAEGDPVTQPWAKCSRTSTGLLQRSKSVVTLTQQPTTHSRLQCY